MTTQNHASGRFVVRIDPGLHRFLRKAASDLGISLNRYCETMLAAPVDFTAVGMAAPVIGRAQEIVGAGLVGLVVFGSWARGETMTDSDVDVLIVVDRRVDLSRDLYRQADRADLKWGDHPIEQHFVHFPKQGHDFAGIWSEVALDGIVIFEHEWRLSRLLASIRHKIADGQIVRRSVHGQPYWTQVM